MKTCVVTCIFCENNETKVVFSGDDGIFTIPFDDMNIPNFHVGDKLNYHYDGRKHIVYNFLIRGAIENIRVDCLSIFIKVNGGWYDEPDGLNSGCFEVGDNVCLHVDEENDAVRVFLDE